jgi:hypothetical protein
MSVNAAHEQRHAELAWAVARWAEPRLDRAARRRLRAARAAAVDALDRELADDPPLPLVRVAGLPSRAAARALFDQARARHWAHWQQRQPLEWWLSMAPSRRRRYCLRSMP